jgi:hypothetical protein
LIFFKSPKSKKSTKTKTLKVKDLNAPKIEMQKYLCQMNMKSEEIQIVFNSRSKALRVKQMYDMWIVGFLLLNMYLIIT